MIKHRATILENGIGEWVRFTHFNTKKRTIQVYTTHGGMGEDSLDTPSGREELPRFTAYHLHGTRDSSQVPVIIKMLEAIRDMFGILDKE